MPFSSSEEGLRTGLGLHQAGQYAEAERAYRDVLAVDSNNAWACYLLGALSNQTGRAREGLELITRSVQLGLRGPEQFNHLGECYRSLGRFEEAINSYQSALQMNPQQAEAMANLGTTLNVLGRHGDALRWLEKAVTLRPDLADAHYNYGLALVKVGRLKEAIQQWEVTLQLRPTHQAAMNQLGQGLQQAGDIRRAMAVLSDLVQRNPTYADGHSSYAFALFLIGQHDRAIEMAKHAVTLAPDRADGYVTLGMIYIGVMRYEDALAEIRKAVDLSPKDYNIHFNLGTILLQLGQYPEGFQELDWREDYQDFAVRVRKANRKIWDGSNLAGKSILIHGEQGFGDIILFARYIPLLVKKGAIVDVFAWKEICTLLRSIKGITNVVSPDDVRVEKYEWHYPLLSLAGPFKTTVETVPANVPYLFPDKSYIEKWKPIVDAHAKGLKVGIIWGGNATPDPCRSCSMKNVSMFSDVPGISWYSLQVGDHREALKTAPREMNILDVGKDFGNFAETAELVRAGKLPGPTPTNLDFADTAAVMSQLDLIITIDTSAANLAGALGLKAWVMLPAAADWRWMLKGDTTPWYPTLRLFRQKKLNDWGPVIEQIRAELIELVKTRQ